MDSTTVMLIIVGIVILGLCVFSFRFSNGPTDPESEQTGAEDGEKTKQ